MATNLSHLHSFFSNHKNQNPAKEIKSDFVCFDTADKIFSQAKKLNISIEPLNINYIVKKMFKLDLEETDLGKETSGFLEKINDKWTIFVNSRESDYRKRFTVVHELAHYIKHRDNCPLKKDQIFFRDENTNSIEREANEFAANLLMPKEMFEKYIDEGYDTISSLADKFQLSTSAVRYRAFKLGFISEC
ncbi:MAG: ImmA/IrrE family metallo-endopeptidase [Campylobacteraceae bacterium]|jgi:Zn-dependent peptidase ImmA (M78 family)|nr:ImmA/IrrE family metallo-endopeptidase [Campylobacteraceae bacterium]